MIYFSFQDSLLSRAPFSLPTIPNIIWLLLLGKSSSSGASATGTSVSDHLSGLTKFQMLQLTRKLDVQSNHSRDMKKAAFRVFAALAANDEDLRKRIIDTDRLMTGIVSALNAGTGHGPDAVGNAKLQMAAVSCLHSLSRSVQLLRTSFQVNYKKA